MTVVYGDGGFGFTRQLSEIEIEEYEYVPSRRRLNTGMLKAGAVIQQSGGFSIREASPDAAIYKRGFVISGRILRRSTKDTRDRSLSEESKKKTSLPGKHDEITAWREEGIYGAAKHQMSGSEEQDSSTGQDKKDSKG